MSPQHRDPCRGGRRGDSQCPPAAPVSHSCPCCSHRCLLLCTVFLLLPLHLAEAMQPAEASEGELGHHLEHPRGPLAAQHPLRGNNSTPTGHGDGDRIARSPQQHSGTAGMLRAQGSIPSTLSSGGSRLSPVPHPHIPAEPCRTGAYLEWLCTEGPREGSGAERTAEPWGRRRRWCW